jgi:hypothetical protein
MWMDLISRFDFVSKMNIAAVCAALVFVGAIVVGVL